MREERVSIGGALLWTVTSGDGAPMVLAHGGPGMWDYLQSVARMVDDLVTVHRYDQRGCGRSATGPPYRIGDFLRDLDGLRRHWGHKRWIVGGHSWGSQLALLYAARNPARVAGLVLLDTVGLAAPDWSAKRRERLGDQAMQRMRELQDRLDAGSDPEADRELTHLSMRAEFARPEMAAHFVHELAASGLESDPRVSRALLRQRSRWLRRPDVRAALRALDVPALVVHGEADLRPPDHAEELAGLLRRGRLVLVPDAGHFSFLERPEVVRPALREWLAELV